mmetsp:Transcript_4216/g.12804  ORF Transcript_4216/g.12804 Transcript_4216/m.12804 type:complete len:225 (-) Transcript_4216:103-777(-)
MWGRLCSGCRPGPGATHPKAQHFGLPQLLVPPHLLQEGRSRARGRTCDARAAAAATAAPRSAVDDGQLLHLCAPAAPAALAATATATATAGKAALAIVTRPAGTCPEPSPGRAGLRLPLRRWLRRAVAELAVRLLLQVDPLLGHLGHLALQLDQLAFLSQGDLALLLVLLLLALELSLALPGVPTAVAAGAIGRAPRWGSHSRRGHRGGPCRAPTAAGAATPVR